MSKKADGITCLKCGRKLNAWSPEYIEKHIAKCSRTHRPVFLSGKRGRPTKEEAKELERRRRKILEILENED